MRPGGRLLAPVSAHHDRQVGGDDALEPRPGSDFSVMPLNRGPVLRMYPVELAGVPVELLPALVLEAVEVGLRSANRGR